jgi:hypothetical protein
VVPDVVETVFPSLGQAPAEFFLVGGRANRIRENAIVTIAAQENWLTVKKEFSSSHLELPHSEANRASVNHPALVQQPNAGRVKMRGFRRPEFRIGEASDQGCFHRALRDRALDRHDHRAIRMQDVGGNRELACFGALDSDADLRRLIGQPGHDKNVCEACGRYGFERHRLMNATPGHVKKIECVEATHEWIHFTLAARVTRTAR